MSKKTPTQRLTDENRPTITLPPLTARLDHDFDRYNNGSMRFMIEDCTAKIKDENGKEVGFVSGPVGGGLAISCGERQWFIDPIQIFKAVLEAEEQYKKEI